MKLLMLLVIVTALASQVGCADLSPAPKPAAGRPVEATAAVAALVTSADNKLKPFRPTITTRDEHARHVPMAYTTTPWGPGKIQFEVPEYVHGRLPGDPGDAILFSGRPLHVAAKIGGVRCRSLAKPDWEASPNGPTLDNPLTHNLIIRFQIIPHDRMIEVRWGMTNEGDKPVRNAWAQICFKGWMDPVLAERLPSSSWMLGDGKLISWDSAGQDMSWIPGERHKDGVRFKRSCFFRARIGKGPAKGLFKENSRGDSTTFLLGRKVDFPAIAKADSKKRRSAIVYSPYSKEVFYNYFQPCFHADPWMGAILPKSTKWVSTYLIFFEGDLAKFMTDLAAAHKRITAGKSE